MSVLVAAHATSGAGIVVRADPLRIFDCRPGSAAPPPAGKERASRAAAQRRRRS
jgi:hypothetical protein